MDTMASFASRRIDRLRGPPSPPQQTRQAGGHFERACALNAEQTIRNSHECTSEPPIEPTIHDRAFCSPFVNELSPIRTHRLTVDPREVIHQRRTKHEQHIHVYGHGIIRLVERSLGHASWRRARRTAADWRLKHVTDSFSGPTETVLTNRTVGLTLPGRRGALTRPESSAVVSFVRGFARYWVLSSSQVRQGVVGFAGMTDLRCSYEDVVSFSSLVLRLVNVCVWKKKCTRLYSYSLISLPSSKNTSATKKSSEWDT